MNSLADLTATKTDVDTSHPDSSSVALWPGLT